MITQPCQDWDNLVNDLLTVLHARCRWRLPILLFGMLFAQGRRTITRWLRAAGVAQGFRCYYYFIERLGYKCDQIARRLFLLLLQRVSVDDRLILALDDTPTKRYGPKVQGAGLHHNPTSGPADEKFLYGHIWVVLALLVRHRHWGTVGLSLLARLYVRKKDVSKLPSSLGWTFRTKFELAVEMVQWAAKIAQTAGKSLWVVVDGFYATRKLMKPFRRDGIVLISRLRKDAGLLDLPRKPSLKERRRGQPRKYGTRHLSLPKRAGAKRGWQELECTLYGQRVCKRYKTFLATYPPAYGTIRVVIVQEAQGPQYFFCTDPTASVQTILETIADRSAIEQDFHDVKEVSGAGQQQVRRLWTNIGAFHLHLWLYTLVELWAWRLSKAAICDRSDSPWDRPDRRPSHADRCKALRRHILQNEYSAVTSGNRTTSKIHTFTQWLLRLAT